MRSRLYADPTGLFLHDAVLAACQKFPQQIAILDTSSNKEIRYEDYGKLIEQLARGFIATGVKAGEVIAIYLPNSWEFAASYHAATLAGAIPTPLNPSYREREVRYQLENSGATFLITDAPLLENVNLGGLPALRRVFTTRNARAATETFASLLR